MTKNQFKHKLLAFVSKFLAPDSSEESIQMDTQLFETGIIDSMKIIDLIAFVEKTLDITISDTMISMEHFRSVNGIADSFMNYHANET